MENINHAFKLEAKMTGVNANDNGSNLVDDSSEEKQVALPHVPVDSEQKDGGFSKGNKSKESLVDKGDEAMEIRGPKYFPEGRSDQSGKEHCSKELLAEAYVMHRTSMSLPYTIHVFSVGNDELVTLSEVSSIFETHFQRPDLLNSVLQTLQVASITTDGLARVDTPSEVTCNDGSGRFHLYINKKDVARLLQNTSTLLDTNPPSLTWVPMGKFHVDDSTKELQIQRSVPPMSSSSLSKFGLAHIPEDDINVTDDANEFTESTRPNGNSVSHDGDCSSSSETASTSDSNMRCVIRTCMVNGEEVVCIPDLHKTVIDLFGQSVQVGNYIHRLKIPTHRFSSNCLKHLKSHSILSSKATLCTYITKVDAERLLMMYHLGSNFDNGSDSFPRIEWGEPIILETAGNRGNMQGHSSSTYMYSPQIAEVLKIPLFTINHQVVVSVPDVHKAVQLLNGQSVQLRYNLDKLGITKHKYTYSEVHHLKVLGHLNRPSSCTYITKTDVDRLLQYYTTPMNESRLKLIEWQQPVMVEKLPYIAAPPESMSHPEVECRENSDENNADAPVTEDYSISDLYKAFVGDDLETPRSSSNETENNACKKTVEQLSSLSPAPGSIPIFSPLSHQNVTAPVTRNEETSTSDNHMKLTGNSPSHVTTSELPCGLPVISQGAVSVSQMQVASCSRPIPVVTGDTVVSNLKFTQVPSVPPSSSFITISSHTSCSSIMSHTSPFAAKCTTFLREQQIPSTGSTFTSCGNFVCTSKRSCDQTWLEQQTKKYRAKDEDVLKTLQRKETEMRILHDAYQEQVKREREQRLSIQQEIDQLRDSNAELQKCIERKELEMKILHDSYQVQMELERKKREELEVEVLQLRGEDCCNVLGHYEKSLCLYL